MSRKYATTFTTEEYNAALKSSTIQEYLAAIFALSSPNQVENVPVPGLLGFQSKQLKYTVRLEDDSTRHVFVKMVAKHSNEFDDHFHKVHQNYTQLTFENEHDIYTKFLPDISKFLQEHGVDPTVFESSLVKCYGISRLTRTNI